LCVRVEKGKKEKKEGRRRKEDLEKENKTPRMVV